MNDSQHKGLGRIAIAIVVVGLAAISVWVGIETDWERGGGWAILAVIVLFFAEP